MKRIVVFFPSWRYFGHFSLPMFEVLTRRYKIIFFHTEKAIYGWDDCPDLSEKSIETVDLKSLNTFSFVQALDQLKADVVVVFDKGWAQDRALLHAARYHAIPSLQIQHGSVAVLEDVQTHHMFERAIREFVKVIRTFLLYNRTLLHIGFSAWKKTLPYQFRLLSNPNNYYYSHRDEITADKVCIIGASERDFFLEKEGYTKNQLVAMGSREYEEAYKLSRKHLKLPDENRLLLLSQPLFEDKYLPGGMDAKAKYIRSIIDSVRKLKDVDIAVKPHPREDEEWYTTHFPSDELYVYPKGTELNQAILDSRFVIGFFSTALVNALILDRPVGIIRWMGDHGYAPNFDEDGAALALRSADDLIEFVRHYKCSFDVSWYAYNCDVQEVLEATIDALVEESDLKARRTC